MSETQNIHITEDQEKWIQRQLSSGDFETREEYVQHLIEIDIQRKMDEEHIRQEVQKGLDSGISDRSLDTIWEEGISMHKAGNANL